jgi:hypothetical protein
MTPSEEFVAKLCKNTFLSLWSLPNPLGKKGKELCDLLVVCDPDVIIFSVKDINIIDSGNIDVDVERWIKRAIDASVSQIYGAERIIGISERITLADRETTIDLPPSKNRNIYRVAVAFGRKDEYPLIYGNMGKGFVHVMDDRSIQVILKELDTITDFIHYLKTKEEFIAQGQLPLAGDEEDYLAVYMQYGKSFPVPCDLLVLDNDLWLTYKNDKEYIYEKAQNESSYLWDSLIEQYCDDFEKGKLNITRNDFEVAIRQMARENRYARRILSGSFMEVIGTKGNPSNIRARMIRSSYDQSIVYVILKAPMDDREYRRRELTLRCAVARYKNKDAHTVIGIATEKYNGASGFSLDIYYMHLPVWEDKHNDKMEEIIKELNYFNN